MACSAKELGLSNDHSGLMELPLDAPLGMDIRDFLGLDDHAIEVELTPNRADCLSIRGLAQDVSASCNVDLKVPEIKVSKEKKSVICMGYVGHGHAYN